MARTCRRCKLSLDPAPETVSSHTRLPLIGDITISDISNIPDSPGLIPIFRTLDHAIPVVLLWVRLQRELTQPAMGKLMGVPRTYVSKLENGNAMPTVTSMIRLADALGTTIGGLLRMCEYLMNGE